MGRTLVIWGGGYWDNFMKRNKDKICSQIGVIQANTQKEWSTHTNFEKCII